jgi:hypothetical protein
MVIFDRFEQSLIGSEVEMHSLYHSRWREILRAQHLLGITLASESNLDSAKVIEDYNLTSKESLLDKGFHRLEHCISICSSDSCRVVDVFGEVGKRVLTSLHGCTLEVIHVGKFGVTALGNFVIDHCRKNLRVNMNTKISANGIKEGAYPSDFHIQRYAKISGPARG